MQNPYIHVHVHVLNACCSQAGYLSCVVHRYSEASIGKRFDSCVARLGARVEVEMKPVCSSDPGSWRRGGVDSNLQRRFRSLYVKALFVLIRHVLRRWGPRPGHLRVEATDWFTRERTRRCALSTSMSDLDVTRFSNIRGIYCGRIGSARSETPCARRCGATSRPARRDLIVFFWRRGAELGHIWRAGASGRLWRSACSANA